MNPNRTQDTLRIRKVREKKRLPAMYLLLWSLHVSIKMYGIPRTKYEKITSWLPLSVYEKIM